MPDKYIRIDPDDIPNKSSVANGYGEDFSFVLIDRERIKDILVYGSYRIILDREDNPITLEFTDISEFDKMVKRLEG